jgi:serine/threonine protein kinase
MAWTALNCPQCSAPLPRIAIWRAVNCPSCGALITRTESIVQRDTFRQALRRAREDSAFAAGDLLCGGDRYQLLHLLGSGEFSQVYLARRVGALPFLATIKISSSHAAPARYAREAQVLRDLQASFNSDGGAYFSQLFPEIVAVGPVEGGDPNRHAIVLLYPTGFWGSLAALQERFPEGIDPRHAIWIWRRLLGILGPLHASGWAHGDVRPEHALVHPQDHGIRLIGWASAQRITAAQEQAIDLLYSARIVLVLLSGAAGGGQLPATVPAGLADFVTQAAQDDAFARTHHAGQIDALLQAHARDAFGAPAFVPLTL